MTKSTKQNLPSLTTLAMRNGYYVNGQHEGMQKGNLYFKVGKTTFMPDNTGDEDSVQFGNIDFGDLGHIGWGISDTEKDEYWNAKPVGDWHKEALDDAEEAIETTEKKAIQTAKFLISLEEDIKDLRKDAHFQNNTIGSIDPMLVAKGKGLAKYIKTIEDKLDIDISHLGNAMDRLRALDVTDSNVDPDTEDREDKYNVLHWNQCETHWQIETTKIERITSGEKSMQSINYLKRYYNSLWFDAKKGHRETRVVRGQKVSVQVGGNQVNYRQYAYLRALISSTLCAWSTLPNNVRFWGEKMERDTKNVEKIRGEENPAGKNAPSVRLSIDTVSDNGIDTEVSQFPATYGRIGMSEDEMIARIDR